MTRKNDTDSTRQQTTRTLILETAGKLIAKRGYSETSASLIAAEAEVDPASINYHFGTRPGLYQEVLTEAHRRLLSIDELQAMLQKNVDAEQKLHAIFSQLVSHIMQTTNNWPLRVLARELLSPTVHIRVMFEKEALPKVRLIRSLVSQITGIPEDAPELSLCIVQAIAPCLLMVIGYRQPPSPLADIVKIPPETLVNHLCQSALSIFAGAKEHYLKGE